MIRLLHQITRIEFDLCASEEAALAREELLITVLALMYRYVFVVIDEVERLQRARASRTFLPGRAVAWRGGAGVVGQLFVRSSERAERVYAAMCARGWRP